MSASVEENVLYYASCTEHQFYSEDFDSPGAARAEARAHNEEFHADE